MQPERDRIEEDLRGIVAGEVLCDEHSRSLYATDASLFEIMPLAVVRPRGTADVAATLGWAAEHGIPVHARGGGTNIAGSAIGRGIVIDCSRWMRRIIADESDGTTVRVQPGVVAAQLDSFLAARGRRLGPDPATAAVTTIGGMIGRDTSGSRFLRYGSLRERLVSAEVVLADGSVHRLEAVEPATGSSHEPRRSHPPAGIAARLERILSAHRGVIHRSQPPSRATHGGYRLHDLESGGRIDLPRLLCGSEGTLGIVTEATLRSLPEPTATAVGLVFFDSLEKAVGRVPQLQSFKPSSCDLFDKRHLALARSAEVAFDLMIPRWAEGCLLVEFTDDNPAGCRERLAAAFGRLQATPGLAVESHIADDDDDAAFFWRLSRNVVSTLHGVRGATPAVAFVEDISIPPPLLADFLSRLQAAMKRCGVTAMLFGHAGHGQLHVRPFIDMRVAEDRERLARFADLLYGHVVELDGSFGGEQGLGLSRTAAFEAFFPELAGVFREVKACFDPAGILNPGRIVGGQGSPLERFPRTLPAAANIEPMLTWTAGELTDELAACNGCGGCRSLAGDPWRSDAGRMCPLYRESPCEEASPRAKANLLARGLANPGGETSLDADEARRIAELCVNCHQCRIDCPSGVDIPAVVMEIKGNHAATNGLTWGRFVRSRVDTLSAVGGRLGPLANWALANPQARWVAEKTLGIARGRKLPAFTGNRLLRWAARRGLTRPSRHGGPRVMLFLDTYARRHDPSLTQALVAVLEHNGIGVYIDPRQVASGMPMVSEGDLAAARRLARRNLRILSEAVRQGYRIIATEPSAVTCLTHDYPLLVDDEEAQRVAMATGDATAFLLEMHREGRLRLDFKPLATRLLYHTPCHVRLHNGTSPAEHLLRLVPGLHLSTAPRGCSGMAGSFGLVREHYRTSLRVGRPLVQAMRAAAIAAGVTECSACRMQMEQGTTKPVVHPVKLLARAYGCLGGLDGLLASASGRLTTSETTLSGG